MSKELPSLSPDKLVRILDELGFEFKRQKGSHKRYVHSDGRKTTVPYHKGKDIDRFLLFKIVTKDLSMTIDKFLELLKM